ncbi:MAG: hypothetical protein IPL87_02855 [Candidatus Moraniibacteriota bacterium]|nr:MAG: hypothetical protein IPL87_02855 [Candidatus Moranbacteria bacterium]
MVNILGARSGAVIPFGAEGGIFEPSGAKITVALGAKFCCWPKFNSALEGPVDVFILVVGALIATGFAEAEAPEFEPDIAFDLDIAPALEFDDPPQFVASESQAKDDVGEKMQRVPKRALKRREIPNDCFMLPPKSKKEVPVKEMSFLYRNVQFKLPSAR